MIAEQDAQTTHEQLQQQRQLELKKSVAYWAVCVTGIIGFFAVAYKAANCMDYQENNQQWHLLDSNNQTVADLYTSIEPPVGLWDRFTALLTLSNHTLQAFNQTTQTLPIRHNIGNIPIGECLTIKLTTTAAIRHPTYLMIKHTFQQAGGMELEQVQLMKIGLIFAAVASMAVTILGVNRALKHKAQASTLRHRMSTPISLSHLFDPVNNPLYMRDEYTSPADRAALEQRRADIIVEDKRLTSML